MRWNYVLKFCTWEHDIPCTLEINSNGRFKPEPGILFWNHISSGASSNTVTWPFDHVVLPDHVTNLKHCISTIRVPMTTKRGRTVTYLDGLLPIKSYHPLIKWPCETTWQAKTIISPLPQCQWPPNLAGW